METTGSYATVFKLGKKIFVVGDSYVKRIKRLRIKELCSGKAFLDHLVVQIANNLITISFLILLMTNLMFFSCMLLQMIYILSNANDTELNNNIINVGLNCKNHGVSKFFISSILVKKNLILILLFEESMISYVNFVK